MYLFVCLFSDLFMYISRTYFSYTTLLVSHFGELQNVHRNNQVIYNHRFYITSVP